MVVIRPPARESAGLTRTEVVPSSYFRQLCFGKEQAGDVFLAVTCATLVACPCSNAPFKIWIKVLELHSKEIKITSKGKEDRKEYLRYAA